MQKFGENVVSCVFFSVACSNGWFEKLIRSDLGVNELQEAYGGDTATAEGQLQTDVISA